MNHIINLHFEYKIFKAEIHADLDLMTGFCSINLYLICLNTFNFLWIFNEKSWKIL